jgi:PII-like signaling protein
MAAKIASASSSVPVTVQVSDAETALENLLYVSSFDALYLDTCIAMGVSSKC